jgi:[NiFe] hydrogenase assembly HybE family chaperone
MNLVRLASPQQEPQAGFLAERDKATRQFGNTAFDFIGAFEPSMGAFETCSLFSPMFEFANHNAAVATATEILAQLRQAAPTPVPEKPAAPSRRGFLFGRPAAPIGGPA